MKLEALTLFVSSAIATTAFAPVIVSVLKRRRMLVKNYRGAGVVRPLGLVLAFPVSTALVVWLAAARRPATPLVLSFIVALWSFTLLGYLDDRFGDREAGGFRGHLKALGSGRVTTGLIKAAGGLVAGIAVGYMLGLSLPRALLAGALVALSANFLNLLDLRPGRALKVFFLAAALMWAASAGAPSWDLWAALMPPAVVLLVLDLLEVGMLGDTGSNPLGAMLGLTFVVNFAWQIQVIAAAFLAVLTLLSEIYSFSEGIERNAALRWLDTLGRRHAGSQGGKRES